jgi:hypothetical protein
VGRQVLMKCNWPPRVCADSPARASYNAFLCESPSVRELIGSVTTSAFVGTNLTD